MAVRNYRDLLIHLYKGVAPVFFDIFNRELNPISFSFIEAKIYIYSVRVKFLCVFCASFIFKINRRNHACSEITGIY
jgi:hypothetical protein